MSCIGLYTDKYRIFAGLFALQLSGKLEAVSRYHTVIMVSCEDKSCRIAGAFLYIMYRGVALEVLKHLLAVIGSTIIIGPTCPRGEFVITKHIHNTYIRKCYADKVRTLSHYGSYEQPAVGASLDSEFLLGGVFVIYQVLASGDKIVKDVLLLELSTVIMPFLTIFTTPTNVGYGKYTPIVHPYSIGNGKPWGVANVKSAIAIETSRSRTVQGSTLLIGDDHRYFGAVLGGIEYLFGLKIILLHLGDSVCHIVSQDIFPSHYRGKYILCFSNKVFPVFRGRVFYVCYHNSPIRGIQVGVEIDLIPFDREDKGVGIIVVEDSDQRTIGFSKVFDPQLTSRGGFLSTDNQVVLIVRHIATYVAIFFLWFASEN